jgi:hypothetical protein
MNEVDDKWRVFEWGAGGTNGWNEFSATPVKSEVEIRASQT